MKIWAQTLVKNEERYIWYSLMSIAPFVDRIMVWDTGSTDNTPKIITEVQKLFPTKIDFREIGEVTPETYTQARQQMLEETQADWFMILDGDEIWWNESIKRIVNTIYHEGKSLDSIVNPFYNLLGDIFHYQSASEGGYQIDDKKGNVTIRLINKRIPGLYTAKPHGQHGYFAKGDVLIQNLEKKRRKYIDSPYLHATNLLRSTNNVTESKVPKRKQKLKKEFGIAFPYDFYYPEVLFIPRPDKVPSPWTTLPFLYKWKNLLKPAKKIKRQLFTYKTGY